MRIPNRRNSLNSSIEKKKKKKTLHVGLNGTYNLTINNNYNDTWIVFSNSFFFFIFKNMFWGILKKKQFSYIFEIKNMFSELNLKK